MRFGRASSDAWELRDIHPLFAGLLAELPEVAARHRTARARLYPEPVGADGDAELQRDWQEHVRPELERHFASSREVVAGDLSALGRHGPGTRLVIPSAHLDAWLNALNQARLILVEENRLGAADLDGGEPPDLATRRGLALLKVHFYAQLQEWLVEAAG
jgi:hypothetical protein